MPDDKTPSVSRRFAGKGVFPYQMAFTLLIPLRRLLLSPAALVNRLDLAAGHHVLEIGPGPGYFSLEAAKRLPQGRLYLYDIQPEMLAHARRRLKKRGYTNVEYHRAGGARFPFADNTFDRIFLVTVLGEVANRDVYLQEIARTLKPGGVVSVTEMQGDPDKLEEEELDALFPAAGLEKGRRYRTFAGFTLNFSKNA